MKRTLFQLILLIALCLPLGLSGQTTHTITLEVNTTDITRSTIAENARFSGQAADVRNEDFTIVVKTGDIIVWEGISTTDPDNHLVKIGSINYEGGARIFDKNVLRGDNADRERVRATVSEGKAGDVNKYKLSFKMSNHNGTFHIDPKIRIE